MPTAQIKVPGIYDDVEPPAAAEKESWAQLPFSEKEFLKERSRLDQADRRTKLLRAGAHSGRGPTFEVHGIAGGFTGAGAKTVIPAKATAKVSFRLVPRAGPGKDRRRVPCSSSRRIRPKGIQFEVRVLSARPG